eukprot:3148116-Pyramimonas_sp.AAC.1
MVTVGKQGVSGHGHPLQGPPNAIHVCGIVARVHIDLVIPEKYDGFSSDEYVCLGLSTSLTGLKTCYGCLAFLHISFGVVRPVAVDHPLFGVVWLSCRKLLLLILALFAAALSFLLPLPP